MTTPFHQISDNESEHSQISSSKSENNFGQFPDNPRYSKVIPRTARPKTQTDSTLWPDTPFSYTHTSSQNRPEDVEDVGSWDNLIESSESNQPTTDNNLPSEHIYERLPSENEPSEHVYETVYTEESCASSAGPPNETFEELVTQSRLIINNLSRESVVISPDHD